MSEEIYQSIKTTTLKLQEPYKLKLVPYAKGYKIELTLNGDEYLADHIAKKDGPIVRMIQAAKKLVTEEMKSVIIEEVE